MQFQVPQFETEEKFFGPFTTTHFLSISIAGAISFLLFPIFTIWLWLLVAAILIGGSLSVALVKINGRPMTIFISSALQYFWGAKVLSIKPAVIENPTIQGIQPLAPLKKFEVPKQPSSFPPLPSEYQATPPPIPSAPPAPPAPPQSIASPAYKEMAISSDAPIPRISSHIITLEEEAPAPPSSMSSTIAISHPSVPRPIVEDGSIPAMPPAPTYSPHKKSRLQSLFNQITTTSSPIPFREKSLKQDDAKQTGKYELIQKTTGETITARRVDYR